MIRDPSDGSVRENPVVKPDTTGLPINKDQAEELARLDKSREWLKRYRTPKQETGGE